MAILFGRVAALGEKNGVTLQLDNGEQLAVDAETLKAFPTLQLGVGDRIRVQWQDGRIARLSLLASALPASSASSQSSQIFSARIVFVEHLSRTLHLETPEGSLQLKFADLSADQWQTLSPGQQVTVVHGPEGDYTLKLPTPKTAPRETAPGPLPLVATLQGAGVITQVGEYQIFVEAEQQQTYRFLRNRFPGRAFHQGDRVTFRAIKDVGEIVEITVLERQAPGLGGTDPCGPLLRQIGALTKRAAVRELAEHFCAERQLDWYWYTPGHPAQIEPADEWLSPRVIHSIEAMVKPFPFAGFYRHQLQALQALKAGKHVLVLTPTASGKTLCYNPAVFECLQADPSARSLYIFPLNALLEDQAEKLRAMAAAFSLPGENEAQIEVLLGGLTREKRQQIQDRPPQILAANPEMLAYMLEGQHYGGWPEFLRQLRYVVLDEAHSYRSLFGLHMAGLVRRLLIACRRYGNPGPQFVLSSATVGAPQELATRLTSFDLQDFVIIDEDQDGSEAQPRHWWMLASGTDLQGNAHDQYLHQTANALVDVLTIPRDEKLNAILFAKSIRDVAAIYQLVKRLLQDRGQAALFKQVRQFASPLLTYQEKRDIYQGLRSGQIRAVISTNALEAGIDIGALDVCILSGFPFHVMRMRQMAGRAGRRAEGAVIFVPDPLLAVDLYYQRHPQRLLTQPPEAFVIDPDNATIARKHVAACAGTMAGGAHYAELSLFGPKLDEILAEGLQQKVLAKIGDQTYSRERLTDEHRAWAVENLRAAEQDPFVICQAPPGQAQACLPGGCRELNKRPGSAEEAVCQWQVQLLDRQRVYQDAHPGAVFEDRDSNLYVVTQFDEAHKMVTVKRLPPETTTRTFVSETTDIKIVRERGARDLAGGARLIWGDVRIARAYRGYSVYDREPRRRCRQCRKSYPETVLQCPTCHQKTRSHWISSKPKPLGFPGQYATKTFQLTLETQACWLRLPAKIETHLSAVAHCAIPGPNNRVARFLQREPEAAATRELTGRLGLSPAEAEAVAAYYHQHSGVFSKQAPAGLKTIYPAYYGQCLRAYLRQLFPEDQALAVFGKATGYPVLADQRHICRNCVQSPLVSAAHTLEHLVALRYPMVALGDSQDLGFTTYAVHPQTGETTVFWYDHYAGGIGAAEKIYNQFEQLLYKGLESLECDCQSDSGCPLCVQTLVCNRRNGALSKVAARGLLHYLLEMPAYVPLEPDYWVPEETWEKERASASRERAHQEVPVTGQDLSSRDPFEILRVQPHVHDRVLEKAIAIRAEEIQMESPPISLQAFQTACLAVTQAGRPGDWVFPEQWSNYQVLHVLPQASKRLTQTCYRTVMREVHPDLHPDRRAWATQAAQRVNAAWEAVRENWSQADDDDNEGAADSGDV